MKVIVYTAFALFAFACNSILCRMALGEGLIDASSFTSVRLISGALVLMVLLRLTASNSKPDKSLMQEAELNSEKGSWKDSLMLFVYAATFSFAYISLDTGTGALILFASVQITMIFIGLLMGNRLNLIQWSGVVIAIAGFVYLVLPGAEAPSIKGFLLMTTSGIAWGLYTLAGKKSTHALSTTTYNFMRTVPMTLVLTVAAVFILGSHLSAKGLFLAVLSGALASGVGYTIWYMALTGLTAIQAAVLQLLVPVIAAIGGTMFTAEILSARLMMASAMILTGILAVILGKRFLGNH